MQEPWIACLLVLVCATCPIAVCEAQDAHVAWAREYGCAYNDEGKGIVACESGGYAIAATTSNCGPGSSDMAIIRIDDLGDSLWAYSYGGSWEDQASCIIKTQDNGYAMCGSTKSFGSNFQHSTFNLCVVKIDSLGDVSWITTVGDSTTHELGSAIVEAQDGSLIVAGYSPMVGNSAFVRAYFCRISADGVLVWTRLYGPGNDNRYLKSVIRTSTGDFLMVGASLLLKVNLQGDVVWDTPALGDLVGAVEMPSGDYVVVANAGSSLNGAYISASRIGSNGESRGGWSLNNSNSTTEEAARAVTVGQDSSLLITGALTCPQDLVQITIPVSAV